MINHNGKEYETEHIYIYVCITELAIQQKLTQHFKSTIFSIFLK